MTFWQLLICIIVAEFISNVLYDAYYDTKRDELEKKMSNIDFVLLDKKQNEKVDDLLDRFNKEYEEKIREEAKKRKKK